MFKVITYKLVTKGRKVIGVDPASRQVEYLPAGEEGEKAFNRLIEHFYKGIYMGLEEWVRNGKPVVLTDSLKKEGQVAL